MDMRGRYIRTDEHRKKFSELFKGKPISEEHKAKLRKPYAPGRISGMKGRPSHNRGKNYYESIEDKKFRDERMITQNGVCAICGNPETSHDKHGKLRVLALDHNHLTDKNRGLLCMNCNLGLGKFNDNPELFLKAYNYLKEGG